MTWHGSFEGFIALLKEEANSDLAELNRLFESEEEELRDEVEKHIEKLNRESEETLKRSEKEGTERARWLCELEQRNEILTCYRREIEQSCQLAINRLTSLYSIDFSRFSSLYRTTIVKAMDELSIVSATLHLPITYQRLEQSLKDIPSLTFVVNEGEVPIRLIDAQRGIELNLSPDKLVASVKVRSEHSIAGVLFEYQCR